MRWAGHVALMGKGEAYTRFWQENLEEIDHLGDPSVDGRINIKMDLQEVGCKSMDWIDLAQDRGRFRAFVTAVMNFGVP